MYFTDVLGFCISILGINGLILYFRHVFPRYAIPFLSALLDETRQLFDRSVAIGAVSPHSECGTRLGCLADQLTAMRMESNHTRGTFQQLRLALLCGMTRRLYSLYYQIETIKSELELAIDKQYLDIGNSATSIVVPIPAAANVLSVAAKPVSSVIEPSLPPPVTVRRDQV